MENKKLNIAEILKNCPKGMELDCTIWDNVVLDNVHMKSYYPIYIKKMNGEIEFLTENGCFDFDCSAKCVIYPKGKTTWEGFVPPYEFKDGDILFAKSVYDWIFIYKESGNDVDLYKYVSIPHNCSYKFITYDDNPICRKKEVSEIRLATEEEKAKLFQVIKDNGYQWNEETKTLVKLVEPKFKEGDRVMKKGGISVPVLITGVGNVNYCYNTENSDGFFKIKEQDDWELVPNKFDITTLKSFDKVLVRRNENNKWRCSFFSHMDEDLHYHCYKHVTITGKSYPMCIPYEGNEHLLNTPDDCEEYFKTW